MRAVLLGLAAAVLFCAPAAAAPSWLAPFTLTPEGLGEPQVRVAVAPDGTTVAVWMRQADGVPVVEAARRRPGEDFGPAMLLGAPARAPQVAMDAAGHATVVWEEGAAPTVVRAARLAAGAAAFEPAQTVSTGPAAAFAPALGVGAGGVAVVLFGAGAPGSMVLRAAIRDGADGLFGAAQIISDTTPNLLSDGSAAGAVAVAPDGAAVAAWSLDDGSGRYLLQTAERGPLNPFPPTGTTRSATAAGASSGHPAVAVDGSGRTTVAWTQDLAAPSPTEVRATTRTPGGSFAPAVVAAPNAEAPDLAAAGGGVIGTWVTGTGADRRVQSATWAAGAAGFSGPVLLSGPAAGATFPVAAANAAGDAMVVWQDFETRAVHAAARPAGGGFAPAATLVSDAAEPAGTAFVFDAPVVGLDGEGSAVALWRFSHVRSGTGFFRIQGAVYDASLPVLTAVSVPATATAGVPAAFSASAADRWSPVTLRWAFGDATADAGGAVQHAFGTAGPFDVTVTATDAAGNAASAVRRIAVGPPRLAAPAAVRWRVRGKRFTLLRLRVTQLPAGGAAELRCAGRRCPLRRTRTFPARAGAVDLVKPLDRDQRRFRAGQTVDLRMTAPGHVGRVLRFKLRRGARPKALVRCTPAGGTRVRATC